VKKKPPKTKKRVTIKKTASPAPEPETKRLIPKSLNVPIDLLCDMAWRIAQAEGFPKKDMDYWSKCVREAFLLIKTACYVRRDLLFEIHQCLKKIDDIPEIAPFLNEEENISGIVPFDRGCQIATGLSKKKDAIARFRRAFFDGVVSEDQSRLAEYESRGFLVTDLPPLKRDFLRLREKGLLRKPYERSGKYVEKKA
jgi:hypothetical protein